MWEIRNVKWEMLSGKGGMRTENEKSKMRNGDAKWEMSNAK